MAEASAAVDFKMTAVLGLESHKIEEICSQCSSYGYVKTVNYNCPGQYVIGGEEKAVDIVKKKYAGSGETVRFDHMEAGDSVVKINNGTAVKWYIVNGQTWEAEKY